MSGWIYSAPPNNICLTQKTPAGIWYYYAEQLRLWCSPPIVVRTRFVSINIVELLYVYIYIYRIYIYKYINIHIYIYYFIILVCAVLVDMYTPQVSQNTARQ